MVVDTFQAIGNILTYLNQPADSSLISLIETDPYGVEKADASLSIVTLPLHTLLCLDKLREAIRSARAHMLPNEILPSVLTFSGVELHAKCELFSGDITVDGESRAYLMRDMVRAQFQHAHSSLTFDNIKLSDWDKVRCKGCIAEVDEFSVRLKFWEANSGKELYFDMEKADVEMLQKITHNERHDLDQNQPSCTADASP
ncbi:MAG: hypothetical protein IJU37_12435 [Desulfovibrio sp.]|nr:hypothetical protein [Desulfovibrio sp.]